MSERCEPWGTGPDRHGGPEPRRSDDALSAALRALALQARARAVGWVGGGRSGAAGRWIERGLPWGARQLAPALFRRWDASLGPGAVRRVGPEELARCSRAAARGVRHVALASAAGGGLLHLESARPLPISDQGLLREADRLRELVRVEELERARALGAAPLRLARLGELSAGLAHDLRNQLALATLECQRLAVGEEGARAGLRRVERALDEARELCVGFLAGSARQRRRAGLRPILERELAAASALARRAGELELCLRCPAGLTVELELAALGRALRNLVLNAIEATPPGGLVLVAARPLGARGIEIEVRDRGRGMGPGELERCMQPGEGGAGGTGYGTASLLACVERLGAELALDSQPGQGTRALLRIQAVGAPLPALLLVVDPDADGAPDERNGDQELLAVRTVEAAERAIDAREVRALVARRTLPAAHRRRLAALCDAASIPHGESSVDTRGDAFALVRQLAARDPTPV